MAGLVLEALTPLAIEAAFRSPPSCTPGGAEPTACGGLACERARQHAEAARRRYLAVDPTNRLVADALEADWNAGLRDLAEEEDDYERAREQAAALLTDTRRPCPGAGRDLPALWHNPATSMRERKRLIRLLVTDVTLLSAGDTSPRTSGCPAGRTTP